MPVPVLIMLNKIIIAIIDTGVALSMQQTYKEHMCQPVINYTTASDGADIYNHGTVIFETIAKGINPKTHCITVIKINPYDYSHIYTALSWVVNNKAGYLNYSICGEGRLNQEELLFYQALNNGTKLFISAGNQRLNLDKEPYYPASYFYGVRQLNVHIVGNTINGKRYMSNYGTVVTDWEEANSTSFATPKALVKHVQED